MIERPEPMAPPDCDLRGYEYMPLFGVKLFGSAFYSLALQNPRAGLAGQKLWWEAWQQCPAGSLPSDDFTLCRLADFGTDLKAWAKAKKVALHGFVQCSDGRLYHKMLCDMAIDASIKRAKERKRKAAYRNKGRDTDDDGTKQSSPVSVLHPVPQDVPRPVLQVVPRDTTETSASCPPVEERKGEENKEEVRAEAIASDAGASKGPSDARDTLWAEGLPILQRMTGKAPPQCRSVLGRLLRDVQDDCPRALTVLREAEQLRPADPLAWITRAAAPQSARTIRPAMNGAIQLVREAEARGEKLAEIPW